jgi:hypothetical protein
VLDCSSFVCTITCEYLMPMLGGMEGTAGEMYAAWNSTLFTCAYAHTTHTRTHTHARIHTHTHTLLDSHAHTHAHIH